MIAPLKRHQLQRYHVAGRTFIPIPSKSTLNNMKKITKFSKTSARLLFVTGLAAIAVIAVSAPSFVKADALNRQLQMTMSGSDVSALQTFLAQDPTLYPQGLVTNYFGFLTKSAVSNFQARNNISAVGRVGPITLPVLNAQMAGSMYHSGGNEVTNAPIISNVNVNASGNAATISWNTNEAARGIVYYSTNPLTTYGYNNSVNVSGSTASTDATFKFSQSVSFSGLQPNTTYYYLIYATDQTGGVSVTWPTTFHTNQ